MRQVLYSTYSFLSSYSSSLDSPGQWPAYVFHLSLQLSTLSVPGMTLVSSLHLQSPFILLWVELFQNLQPDGQLQHLVCHLRPAKRAGLWPQPIFFLPAPYPAIPPAEAILPMAKLQHSSKLTSLAGLWSMVNFVMCIKLGPGNTVEGPTGLPLLQLGEFSVSWSYLISASLFSYSGQCHQVLRVLLVCQPTRWRDKEISTHLVEGCGHFYQES